MNLVEARALAARLVAGVRAGEAEQWRAGLEELRPLSGREWLLVDQAARWHRWSDGMPASGVRNWLGPELAEPTGFVVAVTSFHVDGRFRERATLVLASKPAAVAAPALAVRLLDHVPQVRARAWEALRPVLDVETAAPVLDVLLAGRDRQHGGQALGTVTQHLAEVPDTTLFEALSSSDRRAVRRWAFEFGHDRNLLSTEALVAAAYGDPDQWVQSLCAEWLMKQPDAHHLVPLLSATSVEARLVTLTRVPDDDLAPEVLERLLLDRAPRVREQARWRARRRGVDIAGVYRALLTEDAPARVVAACLDGLVEVGDESDVSLYVHALTHDSPRVRATAVAAVATRAESSDALRLLVPCLLDASPRVATASAQALAGLRVDPELAETAWASRRPANRRAAWRLARAAGGWDRVEADLRAATDVDPGLSGLGHAGVANWLEVSAATTWGSPTPAQQAAIAALLTAADLSENQRRVVAFCAGIKLPAATHGGVAHGADERDTPPSGAALKPAPPRRRRGLLGLLDFRLSGRR